MKELIFHLTNATDGRIVRIEIPEGVTLRDAGDSSNRPFIPVGSIVAVELLDDAVTALDTELAVEIPALAEGDNNPWSSRF